MKPSYYPETDSLSMTPSPAPSAESDEVSEGIVLDHDSAGRVVGIDNASHKLDLREVVTDHSPIPAAAV